MSETDPDFCPACDGYGERAGGFVQCATPGCSNFSRSFAQERARKLAARYETMDERFDDEAEGREWMRDRAREKDAPEGPF